MKQFFETYQADEKLSPLVRVLPWTHNTIIFSRCKSVAEREYYVQACIKERYSSRELERQINACHFERAMLGKQKLSAVLRELHPNIGNTLKDNYVLEFLGLKRWWSTPSPATYPPRWWHTIIYSCLIKN